MILLAKPWDTQPCVCDFIQLPVTADQTVAAIMKPPLFNIVIETSNFLKIGDG